MDSISDKLEKDRPLFHDDSEGNLISWNCNINLLKIMEECLEPDMSTIETGAGYSTVIFAYKQCFHTCFVPLQDEVDRITDYCKSLNISLDRVKFMVGPSQDLLPVNSKNNCDVVFIDGAHRFPFPMVDWFYCARLLKEGGLIVIDDTDIISCHILLKFMLNDPHWEKVEIKGNFAVFKKLGSHDYPGDWQGQPFGKDKICNLNDFISAFYPFESRLKDSPKGNILKKITHFKEKMDDSNDIMSSVRNELPLSVIINTFNRSELLKITLESLVEQTLDQKEYEVIIIDDGSSDNTKEIVDGFHGRPLIKYFYQNNAGRGSAKNHGIYAAQGKILLFLDDDDIATPTLLEEHIKFHRKHSKDNYAVLNYTGWSSNLSITPLMHFITEVGCILFSYPYIKHEDILDYTYFWTGRISCKRSFLIEHGVFNPTMLVYEDIELGYRLSLYGDLKVIYNSNAVSKMIRPLTFDDFCERCVGQGRTAYTFSRLHNVPEIHNYTEVKDAENTWDKIKHMYHAKKRSARELDNIANMKLKYGFEIDELTRRLLHKAYWWVFRACKIKGILERKEELLHKSNCHDLTTSMQRDYKKTVRVTGSKSPNDNDKSGIKLDLQSRQEIKQPQSELKLSTTKSTSYKGGKYITTIQNVAIDLTKSFNYRKLVEDELDVYSNIQVTKDLHEGGIHANKSWECWFKYLENIWQTNFSKEIITFCNSIDKPKILSLGGGYGGHELSIAKSLNKPYELIAVDINEHIFDKAIKEAKANDLNVRFEAIDLNFVEIKKNSFDVIFAHAALHHILNLEHLFSQVYSGLKKNGIFIVLDIIGKTQVLFWKENVDFAINLVDNMPIKYKIGHNNQIATISPYVEPTIQKGMEGIRQEELEEQILKYFTPTKTFKYGSFVRMICTHPIIGKLIDINIKEDKEYLEYLFSLDLKQIEEKKLRPTEMFAVFEKKGTDRVG